MKVSSVEGTAGGFNPCLRARDLLAEVIAALGFAGVGIVVVA
jgi:hypothetical protein